MHETTEWVVPATVLSLPWILNLFRIATPRSLIMFPSAFPLTTGLWSGSARSLPHSKPQSWVGGWKRKNLKSERLTTVKWSPQNYILGPASVNIASINLQTWNVMRVMFLLGFCPFDSGICVWSHFICKV